MPDDIDRGNDAADLFLGLSLNQKKPEGPQATGYCLNCEEPLPDGERWCDAHCRDDWTARRKHG